MAQRSVPVVAGELDAACIVGPETTLAEAAGLFGRRREPVLLVPGHGVLLDSTVRMAVQDGVGAASAVTDFARPELHAADEAAARALLDRRAALPAVVFGPAARPLLLERVTAPVRHAVVMAGGFGKRLRPLTDSRPKPLLEIGGEPVIHRMLRLLAAHGVASVHVSVNYLAGQVRASVGDGGRWGLRVDYLEEDEPLDTGAGLMLMPAAGGPFFVLNGDVLTDVNLTALGRHHQLQGALATVATYLFPAPLPYGVVHRDGERIVEIEEKPVLRYPVNAGIYCFDPAVLRHRPAAGPLPMVPFLNDLATAGEAVSRFALVEHWNDIGQPADYERAQRDAGDLSV